MRYEIVGAFADPWLRPQHSLKNKGLRRNHRSCRCQSECQTEARRCLGRYGGKWTQLTLAAAKRRHAVQVQDYPRPRKRRSRHILTSCRETRLQTWRSYASMSAMTEAGTV